MGFLHPDPPSNRKKQTNSYTVDKGAYIVVDMHRLQYGSAGRGTFGENYFAGMYDEYVESMSGICGDLVNTSVAAKTYGNGEVKNTERIKACAKRAWERWMNRDKED